MLAAALAEPMAAKQPKELTIHGHTRVDEYYWWVLFLLHHNSLLAGLKRGAVCKVS